MTLVRIKWCILILVSIIADRCLPRITPGACCTAWQVVRIIIHRCRYCWVNNKYRTEWTSWNGTSCCQLKSSRFSSRWRLFITFLDQYLHNKQHAPFQYGVEVEFLLLKIRGWIWCKLHFLRFWALFQLPSFWGGISYHSLVSTVSSSQHAQRDDCVLDPDPVSWNLELEIIMNGSFSVL